MKAIQNAQCSIFNVQFSLQNQEMTLFTSWGVVLKELEECRTALKIVRKKELIKPVKRID